MNIICLSSGDQTTNDVAAVDGSSARAELEGTQKKREEEGAIGSRREPHTSFIENTYYCSLL